MTTNRDSDAYNTGYEAALQGEPRNANPCAAGTWEADNWCAGWDAATNGDLYRYADGSYLRPATAAERRASLCAGDEGVIEVAIDGERVACFVQE
jgi:hypothetical protein